MEFKGGCQCGRVRYTARPPRDRASVCFCRMCQKASGGPFMAFVRFPADRVSWSIAPAVFRSSNRADRGFCPACGTPLSYRHLGGPYVSLTLNSLDDPSAVAPEMAFAATQRPRWCLALAELAAHEMDFAADPDFISHQR